MIEINLAVSSRLGAAPEAKAQLGTGCFTPEMG